MHMSVVLSYTSNTGTSLWYHYHRGEIETTKHTAVWSTHWICHCKQWCLTVLRLWNHKPVTTVVVATHLCNYRFKSRQGLNMFLFDKLKSVAIGSWDPMNESFSETFGQSKLQDYSSYYYYTPHLITLIILILHIIFALKKSLASWVN